MTRPSGSPSYSGAFIVLYDEDSLRLYLSKGVYGTLLAPQPSLINPRSRHYHVLGDYACLREGTHIFFFIRRKIIYAGEVDGIKSGGSFILNGQTAPLGREAKAALCWDESNRQIYEHTAEPGIFSLPTKEGDRRCQPYVIRFTDRIGLKGRQIASDDLYWKLGDYPFPLPSNSIQNASFCILTPAEVGLALDLLKSSKKNFKYESHDDDPELNSGIRYFDSMSDGIRNLRTAFENNQFVNEAHLEASILANPGLLPIILRPHDDDILVRQAPISPFKPAQMDRADICFYSDSPASSAPRLIIELKLGSVNKAAVEQTIRYLEWWERVNKPAFSQMSAVVAGREIVDGLGVRKYSDKIELVSLSN